MTAVYISAYLQNVFYLRQSSAELLLFVQKFKMAVAAILDFIFFYILACMYAEPQT